MKKYSLTISFILSLNVLSPWIYADDTHVFKVTCSSPDGKVSYVVNDVSEKLLVTRELQLDDGVVGRRQDKLEDVDMNVVKEVSISDTWLSSCDDEGNESPKGIKTLRNLSYKEYLVNKKSGELLPEGISGLTSDGKSFVANLLCEKVIREEVACQ